MSHAPESIVSVKDLSKTFRDFWHRPKVRALQDVSFDIKPGEVFGLLGPNGAGKSTAIKLMLGLLTPSSGYIQVLGTDPRNVEAKARVGYLPEDSNLYSYLTAEETLDFYARLFELDDATRTERVKRLLEMVGLSHTGNRTVAEFSKGMGRRVGLAQALVNDPELVILDEPTSGLDPMGRRAVKDLILALAKRGRTVILSSHLLAEVEDVCDRLAILYNGEVLAQGRADELLEMRDKRVSITLENEAMARAEAIIEFVKEQTGTSPILEHPRQSLEGFFLDVVADAQASQTEQTGAQPYGRIAPYLATKDTEDRETT